MTFSDWFAPQFLVIYTILLFGPLTLLVIKTRLDRNKRGKTIVSYINELAQEREEHFKRREE